ncbi:MAG: RluA family pseudouridine synthase [Pseudomonadota bacterium]
MLLPEYNIVCSDFHPLNSNNPQKSGVEIVTVTASQLNQRIDNFLIKQLPKVPRTRVYRMIRKGEVRVNKKRCKPDYKLQLGDQVRIPPIRIDSNETEELRIPLSLQSTLEAAILYENGHILILDKPSGVAVHSGSGVKFGVIDVLRKLRPDCEIELVHRLDRDTSGCLMLAKHRQSLLMMQSCLQQNHLGKKYITVVAGQWPAQLVEINEALNRYYLPNGERRVQVDPAGKSACSRFRVLQTGRDFSIVQVELLTGRTHQIRVHCQHAGHEIAGDEKYGNSNFNKRMRKRKIKRLMLHAASLELPLTEFTPEIVINAPLPAEFENLLSTPK